MFRHRVAESVGGRSRSSGASPPAIRAAAELEDEIGPSGEGTVRGPGLGASVTVHSQARYVGSLARAERDPAPLLAATPDRMGGGGDRHPAAVRHGDRGAREEWAADGQQTDPGHLGVETEGAEDVPGGEGAEVVVAGVAVGGGVVEAQRTADCGLSPVRAAGPV